NTLMGAPVLSGQGRAGGAGALGQVADGRGDAAAQVWVGYAVDGGELGVDLGYGQLGAGQAGADDGEDLAQVRQGPGAAAGAGTGADRGGRLAVQHGTAPWPGCPVQGVLQLARDRPVVFGGGDQQRACARDQRAQRGDPGRRRAGLGVLAVGGHVRQPVPDDQADAWRQVAGGGPQQGPGVRAGPQAPGDRGNGDT